VAAVSAAYPQKGIPQKSGTSWLFRSFGTQPHGNMLCEFHQIKNPSWVPNVPFNAVVFEGLKGKLCGGSPRMARNINLTALQSWSKKANPQKFI
jgi:hypothetical protein